MATNRGDNGSQPKPLSSGIEEIAELTPNRELQELLEDLESFMVDVPMPPEPRDQIDHGYLLDSIIKLCQDRLAEIKEQAPNLNSEELNKLRLRAEKTGKGGSFTVTGTMGSVVVTVGKPQERVDTEAIKLALGVDGLKARGWLKQGNGPTVSVRFAKAG